MKEQKSMEKAQKDGELQLLFGLGLFGLAVSLYLSVDHFNNAASVCDISDVISCSIINKGDFSSILNVPIAVWGVCWFIILVGMAWNTSRHDQNFALWCYSLGLWCLIGIVFVVYLIAVEIYLRSLCPVCTVIHVVTVLASWLAWRAYRELKTVPTLAEVLSSLRYWVLAAGALFLLPLVATAVLSETPQTRDSLGELATCITRHNVQMYGSGKCSHCIRQKGTFGSSFERIVFVDCDTTPKKCEERHVESYPTWIKFDVDGVESGRKTGVQTLDELRAFASCRASTKAIEAPT